MRRERAGSYFPGNALPHTWPGGMMVAAGGLHRRVNVDAAIIHSSRSK
jgi:hypothetical protein